MITETESSDSSPDRFQDQDERVDREERHVQALQHLYGQLLLDERIGANALQRIDAALRGAPTGD